MKQFHYIKFRLIARHDENYDEMMSRMQDILEVDFEKDKVNVEEIGATGVLDDEIRIVEIFLKKARHTNAFVRKMIEKMPEEDKRAVLEELDLRLDDNCDLFIRFDKPLVLEKGDFRLVNSGNCLHVKFSVATYPKKREVAERIVRDIFEGDL